MRRWEEPKIVGSLITGEDLRKWITPKKKYSDSQLPNLCQEIVLPGSASVCYIGMGIDTTPPKLTLWEKVKKFSQKICNIKFRLYICIIIFKT